jgi:hypothetical protein
VNSRLRTSANGNTVSMHHNIRIEHREQRLEVAFSRSSEKRVYNFSLMDKLGLLNLRSSSYPAPSPAGQLPGRSRRTPDNRSYLIKWNFEHVVASNASLAGSDQVW